MPTFGRWDVAAAPAERDSPACRFAWSADERAHVCYEPAGHAGPHVCSYCDEPGPAQSLPGIPLAS